MPKKIKFYIDFEEMRISRMMEIHDMTFEERQRYYSLHSDSEARPLSRKMEIFTSLPNESLQDFYNRIKSGKTD